jgi:hypothetical protein
MRYLGAAVALLAAMTFSLTALGQTPRHYKVGSPKGTVAGMAVVRPFQAETISVLIPRYNNTVVYALTEYDPDNCTPISVGMWSTPSNLNPSMSGTPTPNVPYGPAMLGNGDCPGMTFMFSAIYFNWTAHNNQSAMPNPGGSGPCPVADGACPVATFSSTWSTPDGEFDDPYTFNVDVPVVRPMGEMSSFVNWLDSRANWMPTLVPPNSDSSFDFTGESVTENTVTKSTCYGRGIGSMGSTPYSQNSGWTIVNKVMFNKPDTVGWSPCAVEYYRCVKATPPACGYTGTQQMKIKSQADTNATAYIYTTNTVSATIDGFVISSYFYKLGFGNVTSQRSTPSDPQSPQQKGFVSSDQNCPTVTTKTTKAAVLPCAFGPFAE